MEIKMGSNIKTLIDKDVLYGNDSVHIPKETIGLVCEIYEDGSILIETPDSMPFALVLYKRGEYEKLC